MNEARSKKLLAQVAALRSRETKLTNALDRFNQSTEEDVRYSIVDGISYVESGGAWGSEFISLGFQCEDHEALSSLDELSLFTEEDSRIILNLALKRITEAKENKLEELRKLLEEQE